mmetsp:Transcript_4918/g.5440  ORF Transcript_4918/g.5440 Transcript_4918/m.5440 type:complete len:403 (+) Transcript_4918:461-1669(+)
MEDWIRNVENLIGEDADGDPCPLLSQFQEDEDEVLQSRMGKFLHKTAPNEKLVDDIQELAIKQVLTGTVARITDVWSQLSITPETQISLREYSKLMRQKEAFLITFYRKMLESSKWKELYGYIYDAINGILLAIIPIALKYKHNTTNLMATVIHFNVKEFLGEFCLDTWHTLLERDNVFDRSFTKKIPAELIVPTMRKLGMLDVLDTQWNMYGAWDEFFTEVNRYAFDPIVKTRADKILAENSKKWKFARNSITCRNLLSHGKFGNFGMDPAPQCFQYFSKCSVRQCCNVETRKKPHSRRCEKCWYFHFCSEACADFADMFGLHTCESTPPNKAAMIKKETEVYLGLNKPSGKVKHEFCTFCSAKEDDLPNKLLGCGRCKVVAYCDRNCQTWDWADHKQNCV